MIGISGCISEEETPFAPETTPGYEKKQKSLRLVKMKLHEQFKQTLMIGRLVKMKLHEQFKHTLMIGITDQQTN